MQTFLPYDNFTRSLEVLDLRRLGKQRVEALQILKALTLPKFGVRYGWKTHPAVKMWRGFEPALISYYNLSLLIFDERGGKNSKLSYIVCIDTIQDPWWLGDEKFHRQHRRALLLKDFDYYSQFFDEGRQRNVHYLWPSEDGHFYAT